jgi:hypothetical protein
VVKLDATELELLDMKALQEELEDLSALAASSLRLYNDCCDEIQHLQRFVNRSSVRFAIRLLDFNGCIS